MGRNKRARRERAADTGIEPGHHVFLGDGAAAFGAVRMISGAGVTINVEGGGDFLVPLDAIDKVAGQRVVVRWDGLSKAMQEAIGHSLDQENYPPAEEHADERFMDEQDDLDARPQSMAPPASPPDELPGRDLGSRYGAPPSVSGRRE
jgi:hypothetical protein